jgi:hypothetical protein
LKQKSTALSVRNYARTDRLRCLRKCSQLAASEPTRWPLTSVIMNLSDTQCASVPRRSPKSPIDVVRSGSVRASLLESKSADRHVRQKNSRNQFKKRNTKCTNPMAVLLCSVTARCRMVALHALPPPVLGDTTSGGLTTIDRPRPKTLSPNRPRTKKYCSLRYVARKIKRGQLVVSADRSFVVTVKPSSHAHPLRTVGRAPSAPITECLLCRQVQCSKTLSRRQILGERNPLFQPYFRRQEGQRPVVAFLPP